jgi:hypothetical protein
MVRADDTARRGPPGAGIDWRQNMAGSYGALLLVALLFPLAALAAKLVESETARVSIRHIRRDVRQERRRAR